MAIVLPKARLAPTRINPKILLLYSLPKVGKTYQIAKLENCLLMDLENGADMYDCMRVTINTTKDIDAVIAAITAEAVANPGKYPGNYPYKYLALDTTDKLEDFCEVSATIKYKRSTIGKNFDGDSVLELPKGLGYYYLRNEVILQIERLARVCKYLIITSHVKEKMLISKDGIETTSRDLSLAGKLGAIVCAKVDAIGYMSREKEKLMISFETQDSAIMGARFPHLAGKRMEFDWNKIYLDEVTVVQEAQPAA